MVSHFTTVTKVANCVKIDFTGSLKISGLLLIPLVRNKCFRPQKMRILYLKYIFDLKFLVSKKNSKNMAV